MTVMSVPKVQGRRDSSTSGIEKRVIAVGVRGRPISDLKLKIFPKKENFHKDISINNVQVREGGNPFRIPMRLPTHSRGGGSQRKVGPNKTTAKPWPPPVYDLYFVGELAS
jgi:hypothetical protein